MSDIELRRPSTIAAPPMPRGTARQIGRALSRIEAGATVQRAEAEAIADIQAAHVEAVAAVAQRGMVAISFLSQQEGQLAQAVPLATSRLEAIGNVAALSISNVVSDTVVRLRRTW